MIQLAGTYLENRNSLVLLIPHLVDYLEFKIDRSMDLPYLK
jgi:hypothetical protein